MKYNKKYINCRELRNKLEELEDLLNRKKQIKVFKEICSLSGFSNGDYKNCKITKDK